MSANDVSLRPLAAVFFPPAIRGRRYSSEVLTHRFQLRLQSVDFYGMELATVKEGRRTVGQRLLGEWEGPYYVPIERIVAGMAGEA